MANIHETSHWSETIYEIATTDEVIGGADGISNIQANQLASRTNFLKESIARAKAQTETWVLGLNYAGAIERAMALAGYANLPAGTCLPFGQKTAPTGWVQISDDSTHNRMLRVVNGEGGGFGGTHSPVLNNVVAAHSHSFVTGNNSADHTHAINDPGHSHAVHDSGHAHSIPVRARNSSGGGVGDSGDKVTFTGATSPAVTGISLSPAPTGIWNSGASAAHTHSGTTDNGSSQTSWEPRYVDLIICVKK